MIPNNMKSRARTVVMLSLGVVLLGALIGGAWVMTYMPK